mmetsp:Transcript_91170/g.232027  ORF Transcript_91170/g.232027 Transcript_91170/m.232027 type:complete len:274 (+) Transcript_91170:858-1679(+)
MQALQPEQFLHIVAALRPEEREEIAGLLVEGDLVPEEQLGMLEETIRPGGHADKVAFFLWVYGQVRRYHWLLIVLPMLELALAIALGGLPCKRPLAVWLRGDAVLAMAASIAILSAGQVFSRVVDRLCADPVGSLRRWKASDPEDDLLARVEAVLPGVELDPQSPGFIALLCLGLVLLTGVLWLFIGLYELPAAFLAACSPTTQQSFVLIFLFRVGTFAGFLRLLLHRASGAAGLAREGGRALGDRLRGAAATLARRRGRRVGGSSRRSVPEV